MSTYSGNYWLTEEEMTVNARYIYGYLTSRGWSSEAVCAMLGNMEGESGINAGIWQNLDEGNTSLGYGLVQWTPATKYLEWCSENGLEPSSLDSALARIEYELANGLQWISTDTHPLTFEEFSKSTLAVSYLAYAFLNNYERPADREQPQRATQAEKWYELLDGTSSGGSGTGSAGTKKKTRAKLPLWLLISMTRRR